MISNIIVLSRFRHRPNTIQSIMTFQYCILQYHTCMIDHVIILSGFHDRPHLIQSVMIILLLFWCRPHMYDRLHHYPISSLS